MRERAADSVGQVGRCGQVGQSSGVQASACPAVEQHLQFSPFRFTASYGLCENVKHEVPSVTDTFYLDLPRLRRAISVIGGIHLHKLWRAAQPARAGRTIGATDASRARIALALRSVAAAFSAPVPCNAGRRRDAAHCSQTHGAALRIS